MVRTGFVNLDVNADPLVPSLSKLEQRLAPYEIAKYRVVYREELEFACNWKVLVENFCESYHLFCVHKKTLEPGSPTRTTQIREGGEGFNHHTVIGEGMDISEKHLARLPENMASIGHLVCIYPCLAFSVDPATSVWLSVQPTGPQTLRCITQIALLPDKGDEVSDEYAQQVTESVEEFMAEDKKVIELVQRGLAANVGNSGIMHEWERTNWEFGHYLARQLLKTK